MNNEKRNTWIRPTGHDTLLNGGLLAAGIVGLLLTVLGGPAPATAVAAGVIVSETARA